MTCEDVVTYVLAGLNHDYDSFVASISTRINNFTMEESYSRLLTIVARLSQHQISLPIHPPFGNVTQRQNQNSTS